MYERVAESPASRTPQAAQPCSTTARPSAVGDRIKVPTLLVQGQTDSLFPLGQADAAAKAITRGRRPRRRRLDRGRPRRRRPGDEPGRVPGRRLVRPLPEGRQGHRHRPRLPRHPHRRHRLHRRRRPAARRDRGHATRAWRAAQRAIALTGREQTLRQPGRRQPRPPSPPCPASAARAASSQLSSLGVGVSLDFPGQYARFDSAPLADDLQITGSPDGHRPRQVDQRRRRPLRQGVRRRPRTARSRCCPPSSSPRSASRAPRQGKDVDAHPPGRSTTRSSRATGCAWSSPPPTSATPHRPPRPRTPSPLKGDLTVPTAPGVTTAAAGLPAWVWWLPARGRR